MRNASQLITWKQKMAKKNNKDAFDNTEGPISYQVSEGQVIRTDTYRASSYLSSWSKTVIIV